MSNGRPLTIDMHCHVGLIGDRWPNKGCMSQTYRESTVYKIFLMYARIAEDQVCDTFLKERTLEIIETSGIDKVVCLALDPVYDDKGREARGLSHMWVSNDYVLELREALPERVLYGASVHPYDPSFRARVDQCVRDGAVLLKWLPSAQQFDLSDTRVGEAMVYLATAGKGGKPLPLLLHCGPEYAVETSDQRTKSYDYLTWSNWDKVINFLRFKNKWFAPKPEKTRANLDKALKAGAIIIFAHSGMPYFTGLPLGDYLEHSEFEVVKEYLERTARHEFAGKREDGTKVEGKCLADVSAFATPFRKGLFSKIRELPQELLLYGSDFPTPAFELSADLGEMWDDFKAILKGDLGRIVIPQDNLLDVNYREMWNAFPGNLMFTNFRDLGFLP